MPRVFNVGLAYQSFPENLVGGPGDIAVDTGTGDVKKKVGTSWTVMTEASLEGTGTPVDSVTPSFTGQYYKDDSGPTYYVSTGTTSADWEQIGGSSVNYLIYRAILNQSGTNPPVPEILENTLGVEPVWSRTAPGFYFCTSAGVFPEDKTYVEGNIDIWQGQANIMETGWVSTDQIFVITRGVGESDPEMGRGFITIYVYP